MHSNTYLEIHKYMTVYLPYPTKRGKHTTIWNRHTVSELSSSTVCEIAILVVSASSIKPKSLRSCEVTAYV